MDSIQDAFSFDGLVTSHPVYVPVSDPAQISEIFDTISYQKVRILFIFNFRGYFNAYFTRISDKIDPLLNQANPSAVKKSYKRGTTVVRLSRGQVGMRSQPPPAAFKLDPQNFTDFLQVLIVDVQVL